MKIIIDVSELRYSEFENLLFVINKKVGYKIVEVIRDENN